MTSVAVGNQKQSSVLDEKVHARLLQNLDAFAAEANIPAGMIYHPLAETCGHDEIDYVRKYEFLAKNDVYGLVYTGSVAQVHTRQMAMAAAYLRNFIDARVSTVQDLLVSVKDPRAHQPTVLLVPNFFVCKGHGGKLADWDIPDLLGVLYNRHAAGLQTVVYVESMTALSNEYGAVFTNHINEYFRVITT